MIGKILNNKIKNNKIKIDIVKLNFNSFAVSTIDEIIKVVQDENIILPKELKIAYAKEREMMSLIRLILNSFSFLSSGALSIKFEIKKAYQKTHQLLNNLNNIQKLILKLSIAKALDNNFIIKPRIVLNKRAFTLDLTNKKNITPSLIASLKTAKDLAISRESIDKKVIATYIAIASNVNGELKMIATIKESVGTPKKTSLSLPAFQTQIQVQEPFYNRKAIIWV